MPDQQITVDVPDSAHVACPLKGYQARRMTRCVGCEHFAGLMGLVGAEDPKMPFAQRFAVQCSYPTRRNIINVVED